jgi:asparagine synthase (glutamine-hydrolysing)
MCGFTGHISLNDGFAINKLIRATDLIKYRGPDDFAYVVFDSNYHSLIFREQAELNGNVHRKLLGGFGFRRLSIIDTSIKGRQPMCDSEEKVWIVFNGEIYNYIEIRKLLEERGYTFRSGTDTEVVIYSYIEWGESCLDLFNGMWSFCLFDLNRRKMICSTDRFGIKPFYYYFDRNNFVFSSEVKQIHEINDSLKTINEKVLFDYLSAGSYGNETEETFIRDVYRLPAGYTIVVDITDNGLQLRKNNWWSLKVNEEFYGENDINRVSEKIYELFYDSLSLRLRSDVEIGSCLSGGLDSSGIVCLLDKLLTQRGINKKQKLFTIISGAEGNTEFEYAKEIAAKVNGHHISRKIDCNTDISEISNFIWHNDEPLIKASMFGGYSVYKLASDNGIKVVMDGQGLDEYAGGYFTPPFVELLNYLKTHKKVDLYIKHLNYFSSCPGFTRSAILESVLKYKLKQFVHLYSSRNMRFKLYNSVRKFIKNDFLTENIQSSQLYQKFDIEDKRIYYDDIKLKNYKLFTRINLPGILRQVDRNSMAFSVEARIPFLDHKMVEYLFSIPSEFIINKSETKFAYRVAMKSVIPEKILNRKDKIGFHTDEFAIMNNVKSDLSEMLNSIRSNNRFFNKKYLLNNIPEMLNDRSKYDNILWRTMNALIWMNKFNLST